MYNRWPVIAHFLLVLGLPQPGNSQTPLRLDADRRTYQVILIGNTGAAGPSDLAPTLQLLASQLGSADTNAAVVFLGDLLPCCGMPDSGTVDRAVAEERLMALVDAVQDFEGRILVIPGDRDWGKDRKVGWESLIQIEQFLENALDRDDVLYPTEAFPGPEHIRLTSDIRLLAMNTQWLLTNHSKATGEWEDIDVEEDDDFYVELEDQIAKRSTDDLIVVGHHPLYSNGHHGGHYPPKTHLFPLTLAWDGAYIPLPIIGTLALTFRRSIGNEQHFSHVRNRWMRENLERILLEHEDFIYVSAHDHSLQLFESESLSDMQKYVVSGSAARTEFVSKGNDAEFAYRERGFVSLHFYDDGSVWLDAWGVSDDGTGRLLEEVSLREARQLPGDATITSDERRYPDYRDSSLMVAPEPSYDVGWLHQLLLGSNHRNVWATPVEVPYLNMGTEHGGLTPLKRGGGLQTTSIRLEGADGKQYVLRSVNKDGKRFLPEEWRSTFVAPLSQDILSYSHPHGAFIVPPLADAVGVYHTNPKLVWVPPDPRLGVYQDLVGNMLMLYEERPNKDMRDSPWFGSSADVVGAPEMYRRVTRDNDYQVDQRFLARNRLFDMWMSDWDRHKDQWRWASFDQPDGNGKIYRPIPRDRDQAFNRLNFMLHPILKPSTKFQDYRKSYGSLKGLTQNGRTQDHRFLNTLERGDWVAIADSMRAELTDDVIEQAFRQLPEPVFGLHGEEMIEIGKVRRDKLSEVAAKFYRLHARTVDVLGSNKHERFEVHRLDEKETEVVVYKTTKEGEILEELYRRVLREDETKEIILYGLGGDDAFIVTGQTGHGIMVHAVGGPGEDTLIDQSRATRGGKRVRFYDSEEGNVTPGPQTSIKISADPDDNVYTGFFEVPRTYPLGAAWYTTDDGFVIFGGAARFEHSFRKEPFAKLHRLTGSFATGTSALAFNYGLTVKEAIGDWDAGLGLAFRNKNNFRNFYGLGNETGGDVPIDSVQFRLAELDFEIPFRYTDETGFTVELTPKLTLTDVRNDQTRLEFVSQPGLSAPTTAAQLYTGAHLSLNLFYTDDRDSPRQGYDWTTAVDVNLGLVEAPDDYLTVASALALYASLPTRRQATLALRVGGAHNFGTFPFWASNAIGGQTNLRGYRHTRFSGRSSLYANAELRFALFNTGGELLPGTLGALGFFDVGHVWTDGESSDELHPGYGGGLWYNVVEEVMLRLTIGASPENVTLLFGAGFFY